MKMARLRVSLLFFFHEMRELILFFGFFEVHKLFIFFFREAAFLHYIINTLLGSA